MATDEFRIWRSPDEPQVLLMAGRTRLMAVEVADLTDLASDGESDPPTDIAFPEPVLSVEAGQPIAEAAAATGFADQSHLHRHFQRSLGVTPGEYRRRLNG